MIVDSWHTVYWLGVEYYVGISETGRILYVATEVSEERIVELNDWELEARVMNKYWQRYGKNFRHSDPE